MILPQRPRFVAPVGIHTPTGASPRIDLTDPERR